MNEISQSMYVKFGSKKTLFQASSFEDAAMIFAKSSKNAHDKMVFTMPKTIIVDIDGNQIGRISPNGRVWDLNGKVIVESINLYK